MLQLESSMKVEYDHGLASLKAGELSLTSGLALSATHEKLMKPAVLAAVLGMLIPQVGKMIACAHDTGLQ